MSGWSGSVSDGAGALAGAPAGAPDAESPDDAGERTITVGSGSAKFGSGVCSVGRACRPRSEVGGVGGVAGAPESLDDTGAADGSRVMTVGSADAGGCSPGPAAGVNGGAAWPSAGCDEPGWAYPAWE